MMKVFRTFDKDDCVHYKYVKANGCCGRKMVVGVCAIPNADGNVVHKTCNMQQSYCDYQPKAAEDD